MGLGGPVVSLVELLVVASFRLSSPASKMVSSEPSFVSSASGGRNIAGSPSRRPGCPMVHWPTWN